MTGTGYYWIGQDGNVYTQNPDGSATNQGRYLGGNDQGFDAEWASGLGTRIADPLASSSPAPAGGSGGTGKVLNTGGIANTQTTIDQIPGLLQAALDAENQTYNNVTSGYNSQETNQRDVYGKSTTTNQQNYDSNFMDSIRAGIKGLGGLMSLLRGTGAGGGTAEDIARDTVGGVTAQDIRGGADTQKENQGALDTSLSTFLTDLALKRKQAEDNKVNNERAIRRDSDTQLQDLFGKMAGYYGDVGNTAAANDWMARAGSLTPAIATNSRTQVSPYDTTPVAVQAPQITAFAAPTQPNILAPDSNQGQVGSGIFTMSEPRRKKDAAVPVGV